jgi:hypothetical protein
VTGGDAPVAGARGAAPGLKLTMLSRAYCHLCDEMREALLPIAAAGGAAVEVVDVDDATNAALEAQWGDKVPALFAGDPAAGVLLCHYRLDRARVEAALGMRRNDD